VHENVKTAPDIRFCAFVGNPVNEKAVEDWGADSVAQPEPVFQLTTTSRPLKPKDSFLHREIAFQVTN